MNTDERRDAELRADIILEWRDAPDFSMHEALVKAYAAGLQSMRAKVNNAEECAKGSAGLALLRQNERDAERTKFRWLLGLLEDVDQSLHRAIISGDVGVGELP